MMTADFAHTRTARDNRHRKALALRLAAIYAGLTPTELAAITSADAGPAAAAARRAIRKAAHLDREPSTETWAAAIVELERRPARIVAEPARAAMAPCGCWPARDTGVLYEFPPAPTGPLGWPCPHYEPADGAAIPTALMCGPKPPSEADRAAVEEFRRLLESVADQESVRRPIPDDRVCEHCGEAAEYLSSDGWCDGCLAGEGDPPVETRTLADPLSADEAAVIDAEARTLADPPPPDDEPAPWWA